MPTHTIAENLQRLIDTKTAIASAITAKGGTVAQGDGFEEFPADIASIVSSTTNSGIAHPPTSSGASGFINVSFVGSTVYVSTRLSSTTYADTTATFGSPFQLSNFISSDMTFTIEGYKNSSATTYTMTVKLVPSTNQIVYSTSQSLAARSVFAGYHSIPT